MNAPGYTSFTLAFWHPFGPHGRETPEDIIERKRAEIEANGWTLWSFQYRRMLDDWQRVLFAVDVKRVFVFCSEGRGAVDPARNGSSSEPRYCQTYKLVGYDNAGWQPIPEAIKVPHPFRADRKNRKASAFVVERVIYPVDPFERPAVEWYSLRNGPWRTSRVPTRGEYLIRPGGEFAVRNFRAVLELKPPYLAVAKP